MAQKTELPTEKKRKDSARKGQTLKIKDFTTTIILLSGSYFLCYYVNFDDFIDFYTGVLNDSESLNITDFIMGMTSILFKLVFPFIAICCLSGIAATLMQTRFSIASEGLKLNFKALNPVEGIKKIFSLRTLKECVKSVCYFIVFLCTCYSLLDSDLKKILAIHNGGIIQLAASMLSLTVKAVTVFAGWGAFVLCAEFIAEYFLHIKDLKMEKHEVKQERKETEGNPQIKNARRRAHQEILSGEERAAIRNSSVVMANPSHIAVAIYFNPEVAPLPFIALRVTNFKAKSAISYAEKNGIPVVRNVLLTRRLYHSYSQYSFISLDDCDLMLVMEILIWLRQVEIDDIERDDAHSELDKTINNIRDT